MRMTRATTESLTAVRLWVSDVPQGRAIESTTRVTELRVLVTELRKPANEPRELVTRLQATEQTASRLPVT